MRWELRLEKGFTKEVTLHGPIWERTMARGQSKGEVGREAWQQMGVAPLPIPPSLEHRGAGCPQ